MTTLNQIIFFYTFIAMTLFIIGTMLSITVAHIKIKTNDSVTPDTPKGGHLFVLCVLWFIYMLIAIFLFIVKPCLKKGA